MKSNHNNYHNVSALINFCELHNAIKLIFRSSGNTIGACLCLHQRIWRSITFKHIYLRPNVSPYLFDKIVVRDGVAIIDAANLRFNALSMRSACARAAWRHAALPPRRRAVLCRDSRLANCHFASLRSQGSRLKAHVRFAYALCVL